MIRITHMAAMTAFMLCAGVSQAGLAPAPNQPQGSTSVVTPNVASAAAVNVHRREDFIVDQIFPDGSIAARIWARDRETKEWVWVRAMVRITRDGMARVEFEGGSTTTFSLADYRD